MAPGRSRHHPSGREPITFMASTTRRGTARISTAGLYSRAMAMTTSGTISGLTDEDITTTLIRPDSTRLQNDDGGDTGDDTGDESDATDQGDPSDSSDATNQGDPADEGDSADQ